MSSDKYDPEAELQKIVEQGKAHYDNVAAKADKALDEWREAVQQNRPQKPVGFFARLKRRLKRYFDRHTA
jgi:hypothetical protein